MIKFLLNKSRVLTHYMQIKTLSLKHETLRNVFFIHLTDEMGNKSVGEVAPLPQRSQETLQDCLEEYHTKKKEIIALDWSIENWIFNLTTLDLLPSLSFGLESALLLLLDPLPPYQITTSALLMGSYEEVRKQAALKHLEGCKSAKLKIGHFDFQTATNLIHELKTQFHLRVDVNRAWNTQDSLQFFAQFPLDTFDYVEEPFQNPYDLNQFSHPLAVDESFPHPLSLKKLESLPTLKALIYKPTIQGGLCSCIPIHQWAMQKGISLILSSSFESKIGLAAIAAMGKRLALPDPLGIGTERFTRQK